MKVLHLAERYAPFVGGMEQAVANLMAAQRDAGDEVHLATLRPDGTVGRVPARENKGSIHRVRHLPLGNYHPPAPDPLVSRALLHVLHHFGPFDVIHAHGLMGLSYAALRRAGLASTPLVWTLHDYGLVCAKRTLLFRDQQPCPGAALTRCLKCAGSHYGIGRGAAATIGVRGSRSLLGAADRFIAVSEFVAKAHKGIDATIIPPGIAEYDASPDVARPAFVPTVPFFMFVGRLGIAKGGPVLLDAYRQLSGTKPALLVITSDETDAYPEEEGLALVSGAPHDAVRNAWTHALFGVQPSVWDEPWGMAIAEAMAAGKAVVVSEAGALPAVVGDGGIVVPRGDPAALARAMEELIASPPLRGLLGSLGKDRARSYGLVNIRERVRRVYDEVVG